jgi:hypothetical protein
MADKFNFSQDKIGRIPPSPSGKRKTYYDTGLPGLTLRVTETGAKTFVLQKKIHGRARKIRLGNFTGGIDVREARKRAISELSKIGNGIDPQNERNAQRRVRITKWQTLPELRFSNEFSSPKGVCRYSCETNLGE